MAPPPGVRDDWHRLPWRAIERAVFKLQKRIYQAARRGQRKQVHRLQRLVLRSWAANCLAVRRVTQDNQGKRTAGVDGVKALPPPARLALVRTLRLPTTAPPTRRVWIPKPGTSERRPLGIPTMAERAAQALLKLALEPEWEAPFEPNSYGFRPGRSSHDALQAVYTCINQQAKYVLDADIAQCFDRIAQPALLAKLHTFPPCRRAIRAWLRAGVLDGGAWHPTPTGTPQGGVLSPLLANIALHGLETAITAALPPRGKHRGQGGPTVIRYADDFVILHHARQAVEQARAVATTWLAERGLELKPSKTRLTHTLHGVDDETAGFDFLGCHVRQYPVGQRHTGTTGHGRPLGFKTRITPSQPAIQRHRTALRAIVRSHRTAPQAALIHRLNPVIRGWAQYYAPVAASRPFSRLDHQVYLKLYRWAKRRHPNTGVRRVLRRYWRLDTQGWVFATRDGATLRRHDRTPIRRHVKVRGTKSPYDGDWRYWATRLGRHPDVPPRVAALLRRQQGKGAYCGRYFRDADLPEIDHVLPQSQGGADRYANWQLLHRHCHDAKTATDGSVRRTRCS